MRVDAEPIDQLLKRMRENRPCPNCGSSRIVLWVARAEAELRRDGVSLRAECADCKRVAD